MIQIRLWGLVWLQDCIYYLPLGFGNLAHSLAQSQDFGFLTELIPD